MKFQLLFGLLAIQCLQAYGRSHLVANEYLQRCPDGEIFDPASLTCTSAEEASYRSTFTCPQPDGFFPIPGACSSEFYSCIAGVPYVEKCPGNSIFDPVLLYCVPAESASCNGDATTTPEITTVSTTTSPVFTCPAIDGFYPIPDQCTGQYYVCIAGDLYIQNCPGTSIFDPALDICVPAAVASCATTTTSSTSSTSSTTTTTTTPSTTSTTTTPSTTTTTTTPSTTTTSTTTPQSVTTPNTTISSTTAASTTTTSTTTPSTTTSTTTPSTTTASTTTTSTTTTSTTASTPTTPVAFECPASFGLYPVPGEECSPNFYHCSNYIPYMKTCPPTTYFNPALEVCDYPENIPGCQ